MLSYYDVIHLGGADRVHNVDAFYQTPHRAYEEDGVWTADQGIRPKDP